MMAGPTRVQKEIALKFLEKAAEGAKEAGVVKRDIWGGLVVRVRRYLKGIRGL